MNPSGSPLEPVQVRNKTRYSPARDDSDVETAGTAIPMLIKPADDLVPITEAEAAKEQADQSYGGAVEAEIIDLHDWRRFTLPPDMDA